MKEETKKETTRRLKIIEGHLKKVRKMVEDDQYCIDILNQSLAVQNSLKKVDEIVLEGHLQSCVKEAMKNNHNSKEAIEELLKVFKRSK